LWNPISPLQTVILASLVAIVFYLALKLEGALMLHPQTVWPVWPGWALLVPVLVVVPRRVWLILIGAAFGVFVFYDLQAGVPLRSIAWFIPADTIQVLIAALCLNHFFWGVPQLDSVSGVTKYLFFVVILAPFVAAFLSAPGIGTDYWHGWRICFFSDALSFLTLTTPILSWLGDGPAWVRKPRIYQLEAVVLIVGLAFVSYFSFAAPGGSTSPALLYSLVPFLLWSALRFGSIGVSSAIFVVAFLSIWGAVHGRGPFVDRVPLQNVFPMQLFLISSATPFLVLAALAEERKTAVKALHQREKELLEAQRVAQIGHWQWDPKTGVVVWSKELYRIAGRDPDLAPPPFTEQSRMYVPESYERLKSAVKETLQSGKPYKLDLQIVRPDGNARWITDHGEAMRDSAGRIAWLHGTAQDITERKHAENELRASEEKFRGIFRNAVVGMLIVSSNGSILAANDAFCDCLGYSEAELLQKTVESVTLAEDWPSFSQKLNEALEHGTDFHKVEKRFLHKTGRVVTTESSCWLIRGPSGEPHYFVGEVLDVTQRKLAEEALSSVSRRLIEAHEEERSRIARELHDDISQRLTLLTIALQRVREDLPVSSGNSLRCIDDVLGSIEGLGSDIQTLSHRLHSSKLQYLGLAAACAGFCREVAERQIVEVEFHSENISRDLSNEICLCLFRVLQEALQNAVKHSGERKFQVSLKESSDEVELTVHDSGAGFDPDKPKNGHGLGLVSMRERLKLVDGDLRVESKLHSGTTVHARVPVVLSAKSAKIGE
jgi:PAS domain S-box-containing protein